MSGELDYSFHDPVFRAGLESSIQMMNAQVEALTSPRLGIFVPKPHNPEYETEGLIRGWFAGPRVASYRSVALGRKVTATLRDEVRMPHNVAVGGRMSEPSTVLRKGDKYTGGAHRSLAVVNVNNVVNVQQITVTVDTLPGVGTWISSKQRLPGKEVVTKMAAGDPELMTGSVFLSALPTE
jgi:hypothetical protein